MTTEGWIIGFMGIVIIMLLFLLIGAIHQYESVVGGDGWAGFLKREKPQQKRRTIGFTQERPQ